MAERQHVLIVTKDVESQGGVANYYRLFFSKYDCPVFPIERFDIGSRARDNYHRTRRPVGYLVEYVLDLCRLVRRLRADPKIEIVQVNPSLLALPLVRDAGVLLISKAFGLKVVVFVRGWKEDVAARISGSRILRRLFCRIYQHADSFILLAERFIPPIVDWGIDPSNIRVSRTMFDGELVRPKVNRAGQIPRFIFLSRIALSKGVFDLLEAAASLKSKGCRFTIEFYGFGDIQENMPDAGERFQAKVHELDLSDVCFAREFVKGGDKYEIMADADVFVLPTHGEGCPNSVIEALGCGLFVISTPVGAIPELVLDGTHGLLHEPGNVADLAEKMEWALENIEDIRGRWAANRRHAFQNFEASALISGIVDLYRELSLQAGRDS